MADFVLNQRIHEVRWSSGSCGCPGCPDPECVCALCAQPLGVAEDDRTHDPECEGCERCEDNVPIILFRGEGKDMKQAAFHTRCFMRVAVVRKEERE